MNKSQLQLCLPFDEQTGAQIHDRSASTASSSSTVAGTTTLVLVSGLGGAYGVALDSQNTLYVTAGSSGLYAIPNRGTGTPTHMSPSPALVTAYGLAIND